MIISRISLKGFKNFKNEITFKLDKINLIKGENGTGKSTLAVDSILFVIFGYSSQTLEKLVTRSLKKKEMFGRIELEDKGKKLIVVRNYPTSLTIFENGIKLNFANSKEAQEYLNKLFGTLDGFRKFRMIDSKEGINILDEGKTSVKKTLLSLQESWFNNIRQKLLDKKREREFYNKDKCISKHAPSEKRLETISKEIVDLNNEFLNLGKELNNQNRIVSDISFKIGKVQGQKDFYYTTINKFSKLDICPTCTQKVPSELKDTVKVNMEEKIVECDKDISPLKKEFDNEKEIAKEIEKIKDNNNNLLIKLRELKP